MKRTIRNAKPQPLLKALFKGTDLRGYCEAAQTRTLDQFVLREEDINPMKVLGMINELMERI